VRAGAALLLVVFGCAPDATAQSKPPSPPEAAAGSKPYPSGCSWAEGAPFCAEVGKACIDDLALEFNFKKFPYKLGCYDFCSKERTCSPGRRCVDVEARLNPLKNKTPKRYSVCVVEGTASPFQNGRKW
jgi:hypothetical protein